MPESRASAMSRKRGVATAPPAAIASELHLVGILVNITSQPKHSNASPKPTSTHAASASSDKCSESWPPVSNAIANAGMVKTNAAGSAARRTALMIQLGRTSMNASSAISASFDRNRQVTAVVSPKASRMGSAGENIA